jgi:hypothetical protein
MNNLPTVMQQMLRKNREWGLAQRYAYDKIAAILAARRLSYEALLDQKPDFAFVGGYTQKGKTWFVALDIYLCQRFDVIDFVVIPQDVEAIAVSHTCEQHCQ